MGLEYVQNNDVRNLRVKMCGVILLAFLIFFTNGSSATSSKINDIVNDTKGIESVTWSPGEDLEKLNQQFNGWVSVPPYGSTIKSGEKLTIWLFYRGASQEVDFGGNYFRSDRAIPLIQYGNDMGAPGIPTLSINEDKNEATIQYSVTYTWKTTACAGKGDCWEVPHKETLSIIQTHSMPPVHPSSRSYVPVSVEIIRAGMNQRISMNNSTAFKYNFDLYLKSTRNSSVIDNDFFIKMKNIVYEIRKDSKHYYGIAKALDPTEMSTSQGVFICDDGKSLCSLNSTLDNFTYYDAFGWPKVVINSSIVVLKGSEMGLNVLIPTVIVGVLIFGLFTDYKKIVKKMR